MSNSSPTVLERVRRAAMTEAHHNARRLGYDPLAAYREAAGVAMFINVLCGARPFSGVIPDAVER